MKNYNNSTVRRQDRLLTEEEAVTLLTTGEYGVLSLVEHREEEPAGYGIPLNYVWNQGDFLYIHCAPEGHKLDSLDRNSAVSFTIVGRTKVISNQFTTGYESIIIRGKVTRALPQEERMEALKLIIEKYSPNDIAIGLKYAEKSFHRTEVLRMEIHSVSGKTKRVM